jgi:hypothetical protein
MFLGLLDRIGSIGKSYGSGSGSFYHQAKIVSKTLFPTVLRLLFDFLSLKNEVNVPSKRKKSAKLSVPKCHGSSTLL